MFRKIKKIRLMNFQIHKSFVLDNMDEGMIALVGQSSSGKTAVLRAIKFCLWNQMPGNSVAAMVTHGETRTEVEITFDDGLCITRVRDTKSKENYYLIESEEGSTRLDTPGAGPVKEVIVAHGMRPISFLTSKDILNYGSQHDAPFFINATPQERIKAVGILSNTEVADAGIKLAASKVRENKKTASALRKTLTEKNARLKEIGPLKQRKNRLEKVKIIISMIQDLEKKQAELEKISNTINRLRDDIDKLDQILSREDEQELSEMFTDRVVEATEKIVSLSRIKSSVLNASTYLKAYGEFLERAPSDEDIESLLDDLSKHLDITADINYMSRYKDRISKVREDIDKTETTIRKESEVNDTEDNLEIVLDRVNKAMSLSKASNKIEVAKERLKQNEELEADALLEYDNVVDQLIDSFDEAGVCPLCESDLTEESAKKIVKEYELN